MPYINILFLSVNVYFLCCFLLGFSLLIGGDSLCFEHYFLQLVYLKVSFLVYASWGAVFVYFLILWQHLVNIVS